MVNVNKLRGKMVENGMNVEQLSAMVGMTPSTLYRKLSRCEELFTVSNAAEIGKALKLSKQEMMDIFFSQYVA